MRDDAVGKPKPMPHDARAYASNYKLCNFVNAYCQVRDCLSYSPQRILIVGTGVGLEPILLREKFGLAVSTLDIDPGFEPDYVGSVHDMSMIADGQFDVGIASHVLEHLPFAYFEPSVRELARVAKHSLIYLPYGGRHWELKLTLAQWDKEFALRVRRPPLRIIDGTKPVLCGGEHYWECGYWGFGVKKVRGIIEKHFTIDKLYHNHEWKYSLNFCLTSKMA